MGRGDFGTGPTGKPRTSLGWLFLVLVPVAIVLIHFDVLSFGTQPQSNFRDAADEAASVKQPVSANVPVAGDGNAGALMEESIPEGDSPREEGVVKEVAPEGLESDDAKAVSAKGSRKLLVGEDTATATHTCGNDMHAVDDDGNACMADLEYRLFRSVIYAVERPDVSYMVCAIPKNGCTYHLAMINRIYGEENYESTGVVHDKDRKNKYYKLSSRGNEKLARMLANTTIPKYLVVRNPLQRTMSAYLNKVEAFLPYEKRTVENFHEWVYKEFPKNMPIDRSWYGMNPHWIPQMEFCGFKVRDVHSYFKVFRVEEPQDYVEFMYKIIPEKYLQDGWAKEANISFREHVLGPRTRTEGTSEKFLKYFNNLEVFDHLARVLSLDIESFGYHDDVKRLRESVKERMRQLSMDEDDDLD